MGQPFLLAQISDPHIGAQWGDGDPLVGLEAVVESVRSMRPRPDAVLVSGDLADNATDSEYEQVSKLLARLRAPTYVLPGNHDERSALRRHFALPGRDAEPVQYCVALGPLRLVVLDSTRPGEAHGALDRERLGWLATELARAQDLPTVVAMHHPPILTGVPAWDAIGLPAFERRMLGEVLGAHRQVRRIACRRAARLRRARFPER